MTEGRLMRWSPLSGIVFAVLFIVATVVFDDEPTTSKSDSTIISYYKDDSNQLKLQIAYVLIMIGAVFFLWFLGTLAARVRRLEGESPWLSRTVLVSGGAYTVTMLMGFLLAVMVPTTASHTDRFHINPDTARLLQDVSYPLTFETALPLAAPLVLAASLVFLRTGFLPRWLARAVSSSDPCACSASSPSPWRCS